ncbi:MAG: 3-oxoacyl-ACP synthase III [Planctomycetaceae bacterium]|nr:3-oxoacyl-ACP synthase III [Planctomycetaceae bacterium]
MHYENVCLETVACTLPDEIVSSDDIERQLEPLYRRLRLPEGRLELMTGIRQRRFWPRGLLCGAQSAVTADKAIRATGVDRRRIGALVHGSVCRDFLEPATACGVHHRLGLPGNCAVYDVSNACLGLLSGVLQVANMIELGQIEAGLVVGTENGRRLVESTIQYLNTEPSLTRQSIKNAFASLTIGSGSAALLLCHRRISRTGNRLLGGVVHAATDHCELCQGGQGEASAAGQSPQDGGPLLLMQTDSETLMHEGVAAAQRAFLAFLREIGWSVGDVQKTFCHQVGRAHRRLLFDSLGLDTELDYSTFEMLGNTGSTALPTTMALGIENGRLQSGDRVAMLGIGSGINVVMLGVEWQSAVPTA